jgi:hypothetical protein
MRPEDPPASPLVVEALVCTRIPTSIPRAIRAAVGAVEEAGMQAHLRLLECTCLRAMLRAMLRPAPVMLVERVALHRKKNAAHLHSGSSKALLRLY